MLEKLTLHLSRIVLEINGWVLLAGIVKTVFIPRKWLCLPDPLGPSPAATAKNSGRGLLVLPETVSRKEYDLSAHQSGCAVRATSERTGRCFDLTNMQPPV